MDAYQGVDLRSACGSICGPGSSGFASRWLGNLGNPHLGPASHQRTMHTQIREPIAELAVVGLTLGTCLELAYP